VSLFKLGLKNTIGLKLDKTAVNICDMLILVYREEAISKTQILK
jgi:hypothetical protein